MDNPEGVALSSPGSVRWFLCRLTRIELECFAYLPMLSPRWTAESLALHLGPSTRLSRVRQSLEERKIPWCACLFVVDNRKSIDVRAAFAGG